jgi:cytochrome c oxidase subunit 3
LLILSGISVTWAHKAMAIGSFREAVDSLIITIFLGFFFVFLQILEYYEAAFIIRIAFMLVLFIC